MVSRRSKMTEETKSFEKVDGTGESHLFENHVIMIGPNELKFDPGELDEEFEEKARKELRETPEVRAAALKRIRELLRDEPKLRLPDDDDFYQKFLRPCKWYPDSAFGLMKRFYKFRITHPRFCHNLIPSNERAVFVGGLLTPLPLRTKDGCRILKLIGGKKWNPKEVTLDQLFRGTMLTLDAAMAEPKTQVGGVHVIIDMDGLSLGQVTYFTPSFASGVVEWVQKCVPARLKGIHIVNQPFIFNMVFAIFKPFLQEKLRHRIHFHGSNKTSLLSYIDARALPKDFGGELELPNEPIGEVVWQYFCAFESEFKVSDGYGYLEKS